MNAYHPPFHYGTWHYPGWKDVSPTAGPQSYPGAPHPIDGRLLQDLERAADAQYHAVSYYEKLIQLAPEEEDRQIIREIREDEMRHFYIFSNFYMQLTGRRPRVTPGPVPQSFEEGLKFAIRDELRAVDFYHEAAGRSRNPHVQAAFHRAALDEQQHASWFLYQWVNLIRRH